MILIVVLYMLLASTFTIGKAVLSYVNPILFIGVRMTIAGLLLLGYAYFFNKKKWRFALKDVPLFAQLTLFHIYVSFIFEFVALQTITSAKACLLYSASPFLTALFSYVLFHDRLTQKKWAGLMIGFLGFVPIVAECTPTEGPSLACISHAEILLMVSVMSSVYGWMLLKKLVNTRGYSPIMVNGVSMFCGGIAALITSIVYEGSPMLKGTGELVGGFFLSNVTLFILYLMAVIIIANIIFYNLYGYLLKRYSATFLSFAGFTTPLFAALYGRIFLGETVSGSFFTTVALVGIGLTLFYQDELKENR